MKEVNKVEKSGLEEAIYGPILFGLFLVGCIGYCISQSDDNCMVYFGRGFKTVCGSERNDAYPSLAIVGVMAGGFLIIGLRNLKKKLKAEADEK